MVTFKEAKQMAAELYSTADHYEEYPLAYVFNKYQKENVPVAVGGTSPLVITKEDGRALVFIAALTEGLFEGGVIDEGFIKDRNE